MNDNLIVTKLTPKIGAEIKGIDLSNPFDVTKHELIYNILIDNKVIFFRNQIISPKMHLAFAKNFGEIESSHPIYPKVQNISEIILLKNNKNNPPDTDVWHTDVTFKENPPFASILYSKIIPSCGGDTLWSCLSSIYESLPFHIQEHIYLL